MTDGTPAGPILDGLGVNLELGEHDRVTEVLLVAKTHDMETGDIGMTITCSRGLDWIARAGLLATAQRIEDRIADSLFGAGEEE